MEHIVFHPEALAELRDATAFYDLCHPGLGKQFLNALESLVDYAHTYPKAGRIIRGSSRRLALKRFPYGVIYQEHATGQLYILAVMHFKRKPGYWQHRMSDMKR